MLIKNKKIYHGNNITMFEEDKVKNMTTIALEFQEAGLYKLSSSLTVELIKDYKASIPENYKNIINKISRKAYKNDDELNIVLFIKKMFLNMI